MTTYAPTPSGPAAEFLDRCRDGCAPDSGARDKLMTLSALVSAWLVLVLLAALLL